VKTEAKIEVKIEELVYSLLYWGLTTIFWQIRKIWDFQILYPEYTWSLARVFF
jgi:hypothetical protein